MVGGQEDDAALLAAMGISPEMWDRFREKSELEIFPENWQPVQIFIAMQTQWRTGMSGPIGMDYQALAVVMELYEVADRKDCFSAVRTMEIETLAAIAEKQNGGQ